MTVRNFAVSGCPRPSRPPFSSLLLGLVAWASYATARLLTRPHGFTSLTAATEARARQIEQRQALIEAALSGSATRRRAPRGRPRLDSDSLVKDGPLARVEEQQIAAGGTGRRGARRPLQGHRRRTEAAWHHPGARRRQRRRWRTVRKAGNPTFKALFNNWKKLDQLQDGVIAIPSDKPIQASVSFTSGFGVRSDPFNSGAAMHPGIDLAGPYGTPIYATADGTVLRAGWNSGGYGNLVELDHGRGITTRYGHMSAILVHDGDHVTRGQLIGRMGSTGRSTGNHLHYEVRIDGRAVNPIPFMKSTDYVLAMQRRANAAPMDAGDWRTGIGQALILPGADALPISRA